VKGSEPGRGRSPPVGGSQIGKSGAGRKKKKSSGDRLCPLPRPQWIELTDDGYRNRERCGLGMSTPAWESEGEGRETDRGTGSRCGRGLRRGVGEKKKKPLGVLQITGTA